MPPVAPTLASSDRRLAGQPIRDTSQGRSDAGVTAMPQFAVFFADGADFGIEMVRALDDAHAQDIARAHHPH